MLVNYIVKLYYTMVWLSNFEKVVTVAKHKVFDF